MFWLVGDVHLSYIGRIYWVKLKRDAPYHILRMSVNRASTIFSFAWWVIDVPLVADIDLLHIGSLYWDILQRYAPCRILRISVNVVSRIFCFTSWVIYVPIGCIHSFINYWQPSLAKTTVTCSLLHPPNEHQWRVNSVSCRIFGNQGVPWISALISELLNALIGKNTIYER